MQLPLTLVLVRMSLILSMEVTQQDDYCIDYVGKVILCRIDSYEENSANRISDRHTMNSSLRYGTTNSAMTDEMMQATNGSACRYRETIVNEHHIAVTAT